MSYLIALQNLFQHAKDTPSLLQELWQATVICHPHIQAEVRSDSLEETVYQNLETIVATFFNNPANCSVEEYAWLTERCINCWLNPDSVPAIA